MDNLFEEHEASFAAVIAGINAKANLIPDLSKDDKQKEIVAGQNEVEEGLELIEQMELAVMDAESKDRPKLKAKLQSYKNQLTEAEKKLKRAVTFTDSQTARNALFAYDGSSEDSKDAYMSNTDRLNRTTQRLQDGHRMAQETTEVAIGIMDNLHEQRQTIQRSRGRLERTDGELSRSRRLLNGMIARARRNKVVTFFIIGFAIVLIAIIAILIATK
eukprot:m.137360 g.137360  ORF g.137360 m.137360 type:complete len:217 (-) comp11611_c0_seq1:137-787(-)